MNRDRAQISCRQPSFRSHDREGKQRGTYKVMSVRLQNWIDAVNVAMCWAHKKDRTAA